MEPFVTYSEFSCDRIEAHVNRVLKVGWVRYIRLRVVVRRLRALDLALQRLLLAVHVLGLCKTITTGGLGDVKRVRRR